DMSGPKGPLLLTFVLPVAMTGPGGALMPISFGAGDAGFSATQAIGSQVGFDPKQPFTATVPNNGRASVFVGATANPTTNQRAGAYTATLILTVSALGWIQAFPRRLTVGPRERQTVRLLARPPAGLPDGEYWLRLVIAAQAGRVPITGVADTTAIQVGLTLEVRTIIGVNYRKGPVSTGVTLSQVTAQIVGDSLITRSKLERRGNAAFIGMIRETLVDSTGAVHAQRV